MSMISPRASDSIGYPAFRQSGIPEVPGIVTARDVIATGEYIASLQDHFGAINWPDGHADPWNHVECVMALSACGLTAAARRGYHWLRSHQRRDGSWPKRTVAGVATDHAADSNEVAYVAAGVWHEVLVTGDSEFAHQMWPAVRRAIDFVLGLQTVRGEVIWERRADGTPGDFALLAGCSSIYQSLRCAAQLADFLCHTVPECEVAADQLGHVIACHPEAFADKSRFSMDWYYPVLAGPVRSAAAIARLESRWAEFVVPGLGVRCVSDQPWVTVAESCELAMALAVANERDRALEIYSDIQYLRQADGSYWTGWQFDHEEPFPSERSSWTAAAVVLAADVLSGETPGSRIFDQTGALPTDSFDPAACGCPSADDRQHQPPAWVVQGTHGHAAGGDGPGTGPR